METYRRISRALALLLVVGMALAAPAAAHAQQAQKCIPNKAIISLVQTNTIISFAKIEKKLRLQQGTKIFGQKLCEIDSRYVYFFKIVDSSGRTKKFAIYADDGTPFLGN